MLPTALRRAPLAFAFCAALFLSACETPIVDVTDYTLHDVPFGVLVNQDVRIEAVDDSFTLVGGQRFDTPFKVDIWGRNTPSKPFYNNNIVEGYEAARQLGAKDVRVYVAGHDKPLYGVLLLSPVYNAAIGPAARSYRIQIPKDKIDTAYALNTAVVYENADWIKRWSDGDHKKINWRTWILWISGAPL